MKNNLQAKRIVITAGEVQLPIKVGEEVCYRYDGHLMWTDRVHRILEVAADYVRIETTSLNIFVQEYQCPRKSSSIGNICLGYIKLIPSQ